MNVLIHYLYKGRPPVATILEYRGKAFSSGADDNDHTIANFLRIYHEGGKPVEGAPSGVTLPLAHQKELNYAVIIIMSMKFFEEITFKIIFLLGLGVFL